MEDIDKQAKWTDEHRWQAYSSFTENKKYNWKILKKDFVGLDGIYDDINYKK